MRVGELRRDPFWPFIAMIAAAPLTLAVGDPWVWSGMSAMVGALLIWWGIVCAGPRAPMPAPWLHHGITTLAACAVLGWVAIQSIPEVAPTWNHPLWRDAAAALAAPTRGAISLDPAATRDALVRMMGYVGVFWLAMQFGTNAGRARWVLWTVASSGTAIALAAVLLRFASQRLGETAGPGSWAELIRPGTPALYLGICAIAALALTTWPRLPRVRLFDRKRLETVVPFTMLGVIVTALLASQSPTELVSAVFAFAAFTAVRLSASGARAGASLSVGVAAGAGAMVAIVVGGWLSGWSLTGHGESRIGQLAQALRAISDTPLTGQGLGTFGEGFHLYYDGNLNWLASSHNGASSAYLELALGAGVAAAASLMGIVAWLAVASLRGIRSGDADAVAPAAALSATVLIGCHAAIGTGLEHPAVSVLFAALLGIGFARSWPARAGKRATTNSPPGGPLGTGDRDQFSDR